MVEDLTANAKDERIEAGQRAVASQHYALRTNVPRGIVLVIPGFIPGLSQITGVSFTVPAVSV